MGTYINDGSALELVRSHNKTIKSQKPIALFVGGTSGIGQYGALKLAELTSPEKVIITGRNKVNGDKIVSDLNKLSGSTNNEFIPCDVYLLKNVRKYTDEIKRKIKKLNYLVLSTSPSMGFFTRENTEEGLDANMVSIFYSRNLIVKELLPLLQAAADAGEEARVITILSAGNEGEIFQDDPGLVKRIL